MPCAPFRLNCWKYPVRSLNWTVMFGSMSKCSSPNRTLKRGILPFECHIIYWMIFEFFHHIKFQVFGCWKFGPINISRSAGKRPNSNVGSVSQRHFLTRPQHHTFIDRIRQPRVSWNTHQWLIKYQTLVVQDCIHSVFCLLWNKQSDRR